MILLRRIIPILLFVLPVTILAQTQIDMSAELNQETYKQWDNYIKKYAPADSALYVVRNLASRHYWAQRAMVSALVWSMYKPLFPERDSIINIEIKRLEQVGLTQEPANDMVHLYDDFAKRNAPAMDAYVAVERIAAPFIEKRFWDSAAAVYRHYKPFFPNMAARFDTVLSILNAPLEGIIINNLGPKVNTANSEWDPNPTGDGRFLFFSSSNRKGGFGKSDVWLSVLDSSGAWAEPKPLNGRINGAKDETIDNITIDGNGLLLSGDFPGTYGNFDIYYAQLLDSGWGEMIHYSRPINTEYTDEGASMTADGKALIFTSDRPGGVGAYNPIHKIFHGNSNGNMDIYVSFQTDSGWSAPVNLGQTINTPFAERSPYLHPDGKTLYFSSDGHPGIGRLDVFKSVRLREDSWTEWSEPANLGKEINTEEDDWGYKIGITGDSAVFAAQNRIGGFGGWDLYSVKLPKSAKPEKLVTIRGRVLNSEGKPLQADIKWENLSDGSPAGSLRSSPREGYYIIALPLGKNYGYYASKDGYYPASNNIDLRKAKAGKDIVHDIKLVSMAEMKTGGAGITVNNVFFDFDKSELKPESYPELNRLADFLKGAKEQKVRVEGHTDNAGAEAYNIKLSERRADAVVDYLVSKGLPRSLFKTQGYGTSKPLAPNDTEEGRAKNRRVEVKFEK